MDCDLVAVLEIRIPPGAGGPEVRREREELVAGGDVYEPAVERDAAQAAIPAAALPVDVALVPVDRLPDRAVLEVDQIYAAVALTLLAATDDRGRDELHCVDRTRGNAGTGVSPCLRAVTISW